MAHKVKSENQMRFFKAAAKTKGIGGLSLDQSKSEEMPYKKRNKKQGMFSK